MIKKLLLTFVLSACGSVLLAQSPDAQQDNTRVNQADGNSAAPTADQQGNTQADLQLTRQIRQALVKDKDLSTDAQNVKIISQNGDVTLRGPVRSAEEKQTVETKAAQVAGVEHVHSDLRVAQQ